MLTWQYWVVGVHGAALLWWHVGQQVGERQQEEQAAAKSVGKEFRRSEEGRMRCVHKGTGGEMSSQAASVQVQLPAGMALHLHTEHNETLRSSSVSSSTQREASQKRRPC